LIEPELLRRTTEAALRHGWQVCTHAIGDKGNALVLDAYAAARAAVPEARDPRLRIEHAQAVRQADVGRFAALGVIASMQPAHQGDEIRWAEARLGPERVKGAYAWRWFVAAGAPVAFGSDAPVALENPFYGVYCALTRQDERGRPPGGWYPEQRLTLEEALRLYTAGPAHAAFAEDRVGVLKPGYLADVTVVDRDLFKADPQGVLKAEVEMTVVDGAVVYEKPR
jgi:predicted amidohydrolase YtcJ